MKNKIFKYTPVLTVLLLIALWWVLSIIINAEIIMPNPLIVAKSFLALFGELSTYSMVFGSILRVIFAFLISLIFAVILAVIASLCRAVERAFYPLIVIVRATPTMSFILLCIIWFHSSISPMIVCFAVIFPALYTSTLGGIHKCDSSLVEMSKLYKVPKKVQIINMYLPSVCAQLYTDSVSTLSLSVKLIIAAEALANTRNSIGSSMNIAKNSLEMGQLFAFTIIAVLCSVALELLLKALKLVVLRLRYGRT